MTPRLVSLSLLVLLLPSFISSAPEAQARDTAATAVATRTLDAMGGERAFAAIRTLAFDFVVERDGKEVARWHHLWDRWDGRYRVEGKNREGKMFLALLNVGKPADGRVWLDGAALAGEDLKKALERAYGRYINDTYWLLMPAKLGDHGVHLVSEGEEVKDGKTYDVIRVSFDADIGLTPKDTYWAYVSKESGLMERWEMVLTGQEAKDRSAYTWSDWQTVGGVRLAMTKSAVGEATVIRFDHVKGSAAANDSAFAK